MVLITDFKIKVPDVVSYVDVSRLDEIFAVNDVKLVKGVTMVGNVLNIINHQGGVSANFRVVNYSSDDVKNYQSIVRRDSTVFLSYNRCIYYILLLYFFVKK